MCGRVINISSFATLHVIVYGDSSDIFIAIAVHEGSNVDHHLTCWLVAYHFSEDSRAHGAADPVLVAFEVVEAAFMKEVTAFEADDVLIAFLH